MGTRTVQRGLFAALLALLAVLVFTGVWLTFRYRPIESPARVVHRWSAQLSWLVAIALMTVTVVQRIAERDKVAPWVRAITAVPLLLTLTVTGYLLPWDFLALRVVQANDFSGVLRAAFDDRVRFVLISRAEIAQSTYRGWVLVHAGLAVAAVVVATVTAARGVPRPSSGGPGSA